MKPCKLHGRVNCQICKQKAKAPVRSLQSDDVYSPVPDPTEGISFTDSDPDPTEHISSFTSSTDPDPDSDTNTDPAPAADPGFGGGDSGGGGASGDF